MESPWRLLGDELQQIGETLAGFSPLLVAVYCLGFGWLLATAWFGRQAPPETLA